MSNEMKICAYLDILGFKQFLAKDKEGAIGLLSNYHEILQFYKLATGMAKQKEGTVKEELDISTFEYM